MSIENTDREQQFPITESRRPINPGAEKWLGVKIPVLDHGFLYLVDYMGNDQSVEQAARVSYGAGTRSVNETTGLVRYLRRHHHTTPFEMAVLKIHAKMPIVVARQWVRHRTASINEESARYSILSNEFYIPEPSVIGVQASSNRQGRGETVDLEYAEQFRKDLEANSVSQYDLYDYYLNSTEDGKQEDVERPMIARELARLPLGVNVYTQWYWEANLHNIFHFLALRADPHAQYEIRVYAEAMAKIIEDAFPISWKAFEDYEMKATQLTLPEKTVLTTLLNGNVQFTKSDILTVADSQGLTNKRERQELLDKFKSLGLIKENI
ncbi:MAG TPA: FAD-dependent thymidylate synthase [Patescibacteria group bacterium]